MAVELLEQASLQRLPGALYNLGGMYERGYGVEQDYEKATEYYKIAAGMYRSSIPGEMTCFLSEPGTT